MVFINYNNNIQNIPLPNTIVSLNQIITKKYNINDFYSIVNGKLLTSHNYNINNNDTIIVNTRIKGGILDILEPIFAPILNPFKDIILAIVDIVELIIEIILLIPKILELATAIFTPDKLLNDVIYGSITGINTMITKLFSKLMPTDSKDKTEDGSGGVFGIDDTDKAVCIRPTFVNLLILVICPPLALFLDKGWKAIFMVIVCGLMTYYMYYFPGFLFAALHMLC